MVMLAVLGLSACGSQARQRATRASQPAIPTAVADSLAHRSDALAAALVRHDACGAKIQAHGLERQTRLAIANGRMPASYRPRLLSAISRLIARLPRCKPPPPPAPPTPPPPAPTPAPKVHREHHHDHAPPPKKHDHDHGKKGQDH